jgi:hypothetical protein
VSEEEGVTDFCKGALVRVKEEGFQERKASLELQSKSLKALSLVHIIIPKTLFPPSTLASFLPKLHSLTPQTLPQKQELVLEPRSPNRFE